MKLQPIVWRLMFVPSGDGVNGPKSMERKDPVKEPVLQGLGAQVNVKLARIARHAFLTVPNLVIATAVGCRLTKLSWKLL